MGVDPHPVRLFTIVRNLQGREENLVCLSIILSPRDKSLYVCTQETIMPNSGEIADRQIQSYGDRSLPTPHPPFPSPSQTVQLFPTQYLDMLIMLILLIYPSLVLVQPRETCPCLTERLLMGHKELNQTNKQILHILTIFSWVKVFWIVPEFRILRLTFQRKSASKC